MPYVQNVSFDDVKKLIIHNDCSNTLLISLTDNDMPYPTHLGFDFWSAVYYQFLDVDGPQYNQAISDVLVHCMMGVNRSGAVREVAEILGFEVIGQKQGYNAYVKTKLIQAAGLGYE